MAYKDKADSGNRDMGMVIRQPSFTGPIVRPLYTKKDAAAIAYTVLRPVGPLNKDRTDFLPWRNSAGAGDFGVGGFNDWFYKEDVFDGGTATRVTFLAAKLGSDGRPIDPGMEPSIAHDFCRAVRKFAKGTLLELKLMQGSKDAGAPLRMPRTTGFLQGMLLERGPDKHYKHPIMNTVLMLPSTGRVACFNALEEIAPGYKGDPDDLNRRFMAGDVLAARKLVRVDTDPASYDAGRVLRFWGKQGGDSQNEDTDAAETDWKAVGKGDSRQQKKEATEFGSYFCSFAPQPFKDLPRTADGKIAIEDKYLFHSWDKVLRYLSDEEMAQQLVRAFFDYPEALIAGLGHIEGALPPSVLRARTISQPAPATAQRQAPAATVSPATAAATAAADQDDDGIVFGGTPAAVGDMLEETAGEAPAASTPSAAAPVADADAAAIAQATAIKNLPGMSPAVLAALAALTAANQAK